MRRYRDRLGHHGPRTCRRCINSRPRTGGLSRISAPVQLRCVPTSVAVSSRPSTGRRHRYRAPRPGDQPRSRRSTRAASDRGRRSRGTRRRPRFPDARAAAPPLICRARWALAWTWQIVRQFRQVQPGGVAIAAGRNSVPQMAWRVPPLSRAAVAFSSSVTTWSTFSKEVIQTVYRWSRLSGRGAGCGESIVLGHPGVHVAAGASSHRTGGPSDWMVRPKRSWLGSLWACIPGRLWAGTPVGSVASVTFE